ncbi:MAG: SOS response-associated peptidase [Phycisphaeraceae bacterium]|nr:SOS response-associated peptidase [Phycisphaerales bacterium]MCB9843541.1 SOS response-associated peptidase [Phycisphaeraceae bacterium]
MCGRYALIVSGAELAELLRAARWSPWTARYNIAPTQLAPILRLGEDDQRELVPARWGLIPSWAKDPAIGNRMINARAETAAEKPAFRSAMKKRRCVIPASGFYEWQRIERSKAKQPWFIQSADSPIVALAGLWELWEKSDEPIESFTILTTTPNMLMTALHDRMPAILDPDDISEWLAPDTSPEQIDDLLTPAPDGTLGAHRVSTRVNSPANDDAALSEPIADDS